MLPNSSNEQNSTSGGELAVPMAWMYAEYIADELLRTGDLMPPTTFEFRAGRDALALTIFLEDSEGELSGIRVVSQLECWLALTAYDQPWRSWVLERLARREAEVRESGGPAGPDLELARAAWRWLQETELLAADLDAVTLPGGPPPDEDDGPKVWTPAWRLGLPLGHLAIHLF
ncbi:hypothetical protein [Streptomyces sp. NPDC060194]|uniref:hypothetical protein n=1 Tax=Streptomyces sp. NPDC060194 TaxID=3347069 RepID=UPI00365DA98F